MKALVLITLPVALSACSTLDFEPAEPGEARRMSREDCRMANSHDPAGPGDWVCEDQDGRAERVISNPN
ncbi:MAG: hypothetical protein CMF74_08790 [Maricaulis sp.]|nr:hypothetical protein [Maricaulis sp.]HAQ35108.1 hypothetical protein [Alphaproteobacteria bacterium]